MYLLQFWLFEFFVRLKLTLLSFFGQNSVILNNSLLINFLIQIFSFAAWFIAIYSVLVFNFNTVVCFLLDHKTTALLKKKQYPITNFLSFKFPAKLLSPYLISPQKAGEISELLFRYCLYMSSRYIVPLRQHTIYFAALGYFL